MSERRAEPGELLSAEAGKVWGRLCVRAAMWQARALHELCAREGCACSCHGEVEDGAPGPVTRGLR